MKPHRIKHIPTGLNYKLFGSICNLSEIDKLLLNDTTPLNLNRGRDNIFIPINYNSPILKKYLENLPELSLSKSQKEFLAEYQKVNFRHNF